MPDAGAGQVVVAVRAAGVNPVDWKLCEGALPLAPTQFPWTLGSDLSGVVTSVGHGVRGLSPGDEVFGMAGRSRGGSGSFATFASADAALVAARPRRVGHVESAALPMTGVRAWMVLHDLLQVTPGEKVLIHGGAGGIGTMAIQIAKHLGAHVTTTVRARDLDHVRRLGADVAFDHAREPFERALPEQDAVFDTVGGETYARSLKVLRRGGRIASMIAKPTPGLAESHGARHVEQDARIDPRAFSAIARLVDEGIVKVHVDRVFPLDEVGAALAHQKEGHPRGKVVLSMEG